ncbi:MAG: helix-turn-helix domain-containing protein [Candidatus Nanohaloarchaea archaeon]
MKCPYELEEVFQVVFNLSGSEIDILMHLCDNPGTPKEVSDAVGKDRSTIQRYLSNLMKTGLIDRQRVEKEGKGRSFKYSVDRDALNENVKDELEDWYEDRKDLIDQI